MKTLTAKLVTITLSAGGLFAAFAPQAKADVVVIREDVYEHPSSWHGERIVRYDGGGEHVYYRDGGERVYYREPAYREPVYYREHVYRDYQPSPAQYPVYNQYNYHAR